MAEQVACSALDWDVFLDLLADISHDIHLENNERKKKLLVRDQLIVALGGFLGTRAIEMINLTWGEILNRGSLDIYIRKTRSNIKSRKKRTLTFNPQFISIINAAYKILNPELIDPVIFHLKGGTITRRHLNRIIASIFRRYNIETDNPSSHTLRKTFGKRLWIALGGDEAALILVSKVLGHRTLDQTRRYIGIDKKQIKEAYLSL